MVLTVLRSPLDFPTGTKVGVGARTRCDNVSAPRRFFGTGTAVRWSFTYAGWQNTNGSQTRLRRWELSWVRAALRGGVETQRIAAQQSVVATGDEPGRVETAPLRGACPREALGLRLSFLATAPCPSGETSVFELRLNDVAVEFLMLARLQRVVNRSGGGRRTRRTDVSRPPARDRRYSKAFPVDVGRD